MHFKIKEGENAHIFTRFGTLPQLLEDYFCIGQNLFLQESCAGVQAGVNASSQQVLEWLVKADTASAFNISFEDVSVTGVQQVCQRGSDRSE